MNNTATQAQMNHLKAMMNLVDEILKPQARPVFRYTCPECEQVFTDPDEVAYGHDCEVES
jgi:hypothetical protein